MRKPTLKRHVSRSRSPFYLLKDWEKQAEQDELDRILKGNRTNRKTKKLSVAQANRYKSLYKRKII